MTLSTETSKWRATLLRMGARLHRTPLTRYRVTAARSAQELDAAFKLLQCMYRGADLTDAPVPKRITPQHILREATVFVVYEGAELVGTLTVTLDSPAGLPLDKDYESELDRLRATGAILVEFNSLAVKPEHRRQGATTLLFLAAHWFSRNALQASHAVVGVNPRIEELYRVLFNFRRIAPPKTHSELSAPVVGMIHSTKGMPAFFRRHYRRRMSTGKAVHEHFTDHIPTCVHIPASLWRDEADFSALPRRVFQQVFIKGSDHLATLDARTGAYVRTQRSDETLNVAQEPMRHA